MSVSTCGQFVSLLTQSNLLAAEQLETARRELATADDEQLPGIVERIVERGWLTGWQARMLLSGRHAFFLGRYKLLDHLGEGGMGSVFKAEQTPLGRTVAIKLISKRRVKDAEAAARFHREIQAAAALSHPHIVAAYDADCVAGRHFLVMEYVEGRDLGAIVKGGKKLPIGEACEYVRQAALGLEHAHQRGMIHRDLKPSNLLLKVESRESRAESRSSGSGLSTLDSRLSVKILDMGLARLDAADGFEQTELTHTGQIVGTPDYISPEQARDSKSADARSDVYSLGCTLFRLVSGRVPFPEGGAMAKLTARITDEPPPLPSVLPDAPPELEAVLLKMMARDPGARYQSAGEVIAALTPFAELSQTPAYVIKSTRAAPHDAATVSYEHPPTIDPGLNEFLQNLETAAAHDEEAVSTSDFGQTLASGAGAPTAGWSAPAASEQPQASDPGRQQPAHAGRSPQMTRAGKKLQAEIAARNRAERRRLLLIGTAVLLLIAAVVGFQQWYQAGEVTLTVDWPRDDLQSATLTTAGREQRFPAKGELVYRGRPGSYRLHLQRDGYAPIEETIRLQRAAVKEYRPRWTPNPATKRKDALAALERRTDDVLAQLAPRDSRGAGPPDPESLVHDPQIVQLRHELTAFRNKHPGTEESIGAAALMSRLPWPVDLLNRGEINPYELKMAGQGDPAEAPPELVAILGDSRLKHWNRLTDIAWSPDGTLVATATGRGLVYVWERESARLSSTINLPGTICLAFSPDGRHLALGGPTVSLHDVGDGNTRWSSDSAEPASSIAFSHNGSKLAVGTRNGTVDILAAADGKRLHSYSAHDGSVSAVRFDPSGELIASASRQEASADSGGLRIRSLQTETDVAKLDINTRHLDFSPDGRQLYADWSVVAPSTGELIGEAEPRGRIWAVSPDGQWGVIVPGTKLELWDFHHKRSGPVLEGMFADPYSNIVRFSPDGRYLAATNFYGNAVWIWETATRRLIHPQQGHRYLQSAVAVSPDGSRIAAPSDYAVVVTDVAEVKRSVVIESDRPQIVPPWPRLAFGDDGKMLVQGAGGGLLVWDVAEQKVVSEYRIHGHITAADIARNSHILAAGTDDGRIILLDAATGEEVRTFQAHDGSVQSVSFSPNGQRLASGGADDAVKLWDVGSDKNLRTFRHTPNVTSLAFSPDGNQLAAGNRRGRTVTFWDVASAEEVRTLQADARGVWSVAFSADGTQLASSGNDGTVRLWNLRREFDLLTQTIRIAAHQTWGNDALFTPDGRHLVTANGNGTVYVLRLKEWSPQ